MFYERYGAYSEVFSTAKIAHILFIHPTFLLGSSTSPSVIGI